MAALTQEKQERLCLFIEALPEPLIQKISEGIANSVEQEEIKKTLFEICHKEILLRHAQKSIFGPIWPIFQEPKHAISGLHYPMEIVSLLWKDLKEKHEDFIEKVEAGFYDNHDDLMIYERDTICEIAAEDLAQGEAKKTFVFLESQSQNPDTLATILSLASSVRKIIPRLDYWLRDINRDTAAGIKVAFKTANTISVDGGLLLMEILAHHIAQPWKILRLISAIMDKPTADFLMSSELGIFGYRILEMTNQKIAYVRSFNPDLGEEHGKQIADSFNDIVEQIVEFEKWLQLNSYSQWGLEILKLRRSLTSIGESYMKETEKAVKKALPVGKSFGLHTGKGPVKLTDNLDLKTINRIKSLLSFLSTIKPSTNAGGFSTSWTKVVTSVNAIIQHYVDELINALMDNTPKSSEIVLRMKSFISVVAEFIAITGEAEIAELIQRRCDNVL